MRGGVYQPGLIITSTYIPQYLWCEKLVASRHIAMHWQSTHAVDKISFYTSLLYPIFIFSMNNLTRHLSIYSRSLSDLHIIYTYSINHLTISLQKISNLAIFQQKNQFDLQQDQFRRREKSPEVNARGLSTCAWEGFQNVFKHYNYFFFQRPTFITSSRIDSQQIHIHGFEERIKV